MAATSRRKRRTRTFGWAAIGLIGSVVLIFLFIKQVLLVPPQSLPPPPVPTHAALLHASTSARQWKAALRSADAPVPPSGGAESAAIRRSRSLRQPKGPARIVIQQDDVNTLLQQSGTAHPDNMMRNPSIKITPAAVLVSGYIPWQGAYAPVQVSGVPSAVQGRLRYVVQSATLAGLPAPSLLREWAQERVDSLLQRKLGRLARIGGVRLGDGVMEVDLTASG